MLIWLSSRVVALRRVKNVLSGDGGDAELRRAIRVQGNFVEYVPLTLVLMGFSEMQGANRGVVVLIGLALIAGRVLHALGVARDPEQFSFQVRGMFFTFTALAIAAVLCVGQSVWVLLQR
ncbi:hypothetical protein CH339_18535 [Rhodobium orientis]|uniref:Glutathione metabolism protein n=2 Tax=Rhodobium orientis TaxID=34017 RepID=A0A327JGD6_9HYPH|nr:hypothetical protein [Rhodobium orientis]RAI25389.1 hypothetical protein CH339_18535 [Rhodobium orientis]